MKITFISYYGLEDSMAASARLRRATEFFQSRGWDVDVIAPSHRSKESTNSRVGKQWRWISTLGGLILRALQVKTDLFFISAPPLSMIVPGVVLRLLRSQTPLVFEERDPLTINQLNNFKSLRNNRILQLVEYWLLRSSSLVVPVTSGVRREILAAWPKLENKVDILVVPNGFWRKDYQFLAQARADDKTSEEKSMTFVHIGNFYGSRNPSMLINALKKIQVERSGGRLDSMLSFKLIGGFGPGLKDAFLSQTQTYGLQNMFTLEDLKPRTAALTDVYRGDVALLVTHESGSEGAVPAKLYEYIALGRPILAITTDPLVVEAIKKHDLGWAVAHNDADELARVILWCAENASQVRKKQTSGMALLEYDAESHLIHLHEKLSNMVQAERRQ